MKYPNAHSGLKKVLAAEILTFVAGFFLLGSGIFTAAIAALEKAGSAAEETQTVLILIALVLLIVFSGIGILALVLKLIGLKKASIDEGSFRKAFFAALISLALSVFETTLNALSRASVARFFTTAISICDIFVVIFVIQGIQNLAEELENDKMVKAGLLLMILIAVAYGFKAVTMLLPVFFAGATDFLNSATASCEIISAVASMVGGILYIIYLLRAIRMLKKS